MCEYTIRHYWSEKTHSATLEPGWLTSGEKLNKEQQEIKEIYSKTIGSGTHYNHLSQAKIAEEEIGDFHIKYSYIDKIDPLSKGSKSRSVTDITMCITKKRGKGNKYVYASLIFIVSVGLIIFVDTVSNSASTYTGIEAAPQEKNLAQESKNPPIAQKKKELSKLEKLKEEICKKEELNVKNPEVCWQYYVYDKCRDKVALAYQEWLKSTTIPECTGVKYYPWDSTQTKKRWSNFSDKIKQEEFMKQNIELFFRRGDEDE